MGVNGIHHFLRRVRAGDGENFRVNVAHQIIPAIGFFRAQTPRDDNFAVFRQRLANRVQTFFHGIVDKAAGVHDDQIRTLEGFGGLVTFGAELGQNKFGIGQSLGATQTHKTDFWGGSRRHNLAFI